MNGIYMNLPIILSAAYQAFSAVVIIGPNLSKRLFWLRPVYSKSWSLWDFVTVSSIEQQGTLELVFMQMVTALKNICNIL